MLKKDLTLISQLTQAYWQAQAQYRLGALLWIVNGFITPLIIMSVWLIVNQSNTLNLNNSQIFTYYFLSIMVIRLTQTWVAEDLTYMIKEGRFSIYLIRPFSFIHDRLAKDQALRAVRLVSLTPFFILAAYILSGKLTVVLTPLNLGLFVVSLVLGYVINFLISVTVAICTFWLEDAYGTFLLLMLITDIFSGVLIPLKLMPPLLAAITVKLPFYAILGFPVDLLMGTLSSPFILNYFMTAFIWLAVILISLRLIYLKAIRSYTAQGI